MLLVALPRPKSLKRILQAAAAFGVERIVLMESWRVEKSFWGSPLLEPAALNEQLILGLEQGCGTRLPEVLIRRRFRPFAEDELPAMASGRLALLAHPRSGTLCPAHVQRPFCLAFGPEGGWTPFEVDLFKGAVSLPFTSEIAFCGLSTQSRRSWGDWCDSSEMSSSRRSRPRPTAHRRT